jgi:hypothetical protein
MMSRSEGHRKEIVAGKPLAVRVLYDNSRTTAFIVKKGQAVTMPDANAFASIGFTDVSDYFAQPYPESAIPTDDWPFFYMVERAYPVTYMIALGMVLLLSYLFVRKTIGFSDPIDRSYLPFFFLGSGFMLVETKAITELGLNLGGTFLYPLALGFYSLAWAFSRKSTSLVRTGRPHRAGHNRKLLPPFRGRRAGL